MSLEVSPPPPPPPPPRGRHAGLDNDPILLGIRAVLNLPAVLACASLTLDHFPLALQHVH